MGPRDETENGAIIHLIKSLFSFVTPSLIRNGRQHVWNWTDVVSLCHILDSRSPELDPVSPSNIYNLRPCVTHHLPPTTHRNDLVTHPLSVPDRLQTCRVAARPHISGIVFSLDPSVGGPKYDK